MDSGRLPVFDVSDFLKSPTEESVVQLCQNMAESMHETGVLIIKDPRVTFEDNDTFLDLMEQYFSRSSSEKSVDARPALHYQVGVTPEFTELPRCSQEPSCLDRIKNQSPEHKAHPPTGADPKERFFWRMGNPPKETKFPLLNAPQVIPKGFEDRWEKLMNAWGRKLLMAVTAVAQMIGVGLGLKRELLSEMMCEAPNLLAPTGTDLEKYGKLDNVLAGFHYDLSFLTIHGKSRFPGLYIWLRSGEKLLVKIPQGCLLVQGGKQLEILTGGYIAAGDHEVVCCQETINQIETAKKAGKSLWRISSTFFSHIASDCLLEPQGKYRDLENALKKYPPILAGDQVQAELNMIKLAKK